VAADFAKILFFAKLLKNISSNKTLTVLNAGFLFRNFSSHMQYWKTITADRTAKDGVVWFGSIPRNQNFCTSSSTRFKLLKCVRKNSMCHWRTVGQLENR
jgi:hypothetical protein